MLIRVGFSVIALCSVLKDVKCEFFKDSFLAVEMLYFCDGSLHP